MVQLICNEKLKLGPKKRTFDIEGNWIEFLFLTTELYTHIPCILIILIKLHSFQRLMHMDSVG